MKKEEIRLEQPELNQHFSLNNFSEPMSERNRELVRRNTETMTSRALKQSTVFGASLRLGKRLSEFGLHEMQGSTAFGEQKKVFGTA